MRIANVLSSFHSICTAIPEQIWSFEEERPFLLDTRHECQPQRQLMIAGRQVLYNEKMLCLASPRSLQWMRLRIPTSR